MSQEDRDKWTKRYASDDYRKTNPVDLLHDWAPRLPVGTALDVACGAGRNAIYLAELGFSVDAIDISSEGLKLAKRQADEKQLQVNWIEQDFDEKTPDEKTYDLIVVFWFVNMALISQLSKQLNPGGYLISMQHLVAEGEIAGPKTNRFRIQPDELKNAVQGLEIEYYHEGIQTDADGEKLATAAVVAANR